MKIKILFLYFYSCEVNLQLLTDCKWMQCLRLETDGKLSLGR